MIEGYTVVKTEIKGRNHTRYLYVNGELVSTLILIEFKQWVSGALIKSGGIGDVKTLEKHRNNGYMKVLMINTIEYMEKNGFDTSVLIGVPNFYNKYGYSSCIFRHNISIDSYLLDNLKPITSSYTYREIEFKDWPQIIRLFNSNNKLRQCNILREEESFYGFNRSHNPICDISNILIEKNDEILGYVVYEKSDSNFTVLEVEVIDKMLFYEIISKIKEVAFSNPNITKLNLLMPDDHPFIVFLNRYGYSVTTTIPNNELGMMRIINLKSLLKKIFNDEFTYKLKRNFGDKYSNNWVFKTEFDCVKVDIDNCIPNVESCPVNNETTIELPQHLLIQFLTGFRSIEDILITQDPKIKCNNMDVAKIFNLGQKPFIWAIDHF